MAEHSVIVTRKGGTALIQLNEPKSMNALSAGIRDGFYGALPGLLDDPEVRCIVITGTGDAFCAGGDIRNMGVKPAPAIRSRMQNSHGRFISRLLKAEKPVITAVNGAAAGAGFSLALLGDIILASKSAYFLTAFSRLGACPDLGLLATLPRAIGMARAKDILLTSRKITADEAWQMGLVSRVVDPAALLDTAMETAEALAAAPTVTIGLIKRMLLRAYDTSIDEFLDQEAFAQAIAQSTEDFVEGVEAFRGKRKPQFKGR
jgi:2-(1,2-epoxy-1,2-dihydrophenyl)acetyl-CoA isomerase